jgi:hypothetical protein
MYDQYSSIMPLMGEAGATEAVNEIGYRAEEFRTGEPTGSARLKWVVIVDRTLSVGQAVNAAVCVAAATSPDVAGLLGPGGSDASGNWHRGLPWAGCSILAADGTELVALRGQALERGFHVTAMPAAAQATRVYDDYLARLACTEADDLGPLALGVIGPRNRVAKLVRRLDLLP